MLKLLVGLLLAISGCASLHWQDDDSTGMKVAKTAGRIPLAILTFGGSEYWHAQERSRENYEKTLSTWIGSDINRLIQSWGPPSSVQEMPNGNKMYTYAFNGGARAISSYNKYTGVQTSAYSIYCNTTFYTLGDTVQTWRWDGNNCY